MSWFRWCSDTNGVKTRVTMVRLVDMMYDPPTIPFRPRPQQLIPQSSQYFNKYTHSIIVSFLLYNAINVAAYCIYLYIHAIHRIHREHVTYFKSLNAGLIQAVATF